MLSEQRRQLLIANKDRVLAFKVAANDHQLDYESLNITPGLPDCYGSCVYIYDDGSICGASAALTDEERNRIQQQGENSQRLGMVSGLTFHNVDCTLLKELQVKHDNYIHAVYFDSNKLGIIESFNEFESCYNNLVKEEK